MQEKKIEQKKDKNSCPYCGDSFVNHRFAYINNSVALFFDAYAYWASNHAPKFIKNLADSLLKAIFSFLAFSPFGKLSDDIEKSASLRSKVIWEEAKRRGIKVQQLIIFGKPTEQYRAKIDGRYFFYESLPVPQKFLDFVSLDWDNKFVLKKVFTAENIPVPRYDKLPIFSKEKAYSLFEQFKKPVIVKPISGSRGRHTTTNISLLDDFISAVSVGRIISPSLVIEEHLEGYVCRATLVAGVLVGFYRAEPPSVEGDGVKTIKILIKEKDETRPERVSPVEVTNELEEYIERLGYEMESVLPKGKKIFLTHRTGRYFGGKTKEMLHELHSSFVPILEHAAKITKLPVVGFDCIVPDPEKDASVQRWGIIECNTLPFIDLHYFALEGKPENIAGMIWDMWKL